MSYVHTIIWVLIYSKTGVNLHSKQTYAYLNLPSGFKVSSVFPGIYIANNVFGTSLQIQSHTYGHTLRQCKYVIIEAIILPEHTTSSLAVELAETLVPHSFSEDSDPTQDKEIHQTSSGVETEVHSV